MAQELNCEIMSDETLASDLAVDLLAKEVHNESGFKSIQRINHDNTHSSRS